MKFLPIGLDLREKECVVVGGGKIGTRKAETLLGAGANVTVVAPAVTAAIGELHTRGALKRKTRKFQSGDLDGALLVVAATDDEQVNALIAETAVRDGVLVCDASSAGRSTIIFGALLEDAETTVAVFTEGRSPALARRTRDRIGGFLGGAQQD